MLWGWCQPLTPELLGFGVAIRGPTRFSTMKGGTKKEHSLRAAARILSEGVSQGLFQPPTCASLLSSGSRFPGVHTEVPVQEHALCCGLRADFRHGHHGQSARATPRAIHCQRLKPGLASKEHRILLSPVT